MDTSNNNNNNNNNNNYNNNKKKIDKIGAKKREKDVLVIVKIVSRINHSVRA